MKTKWMFVIVVALFCALGAGTAWPQATAGKVQGKITSGGKPLADASVVLTNLATGKTYKIKTDKNGQFTGVGIVFGEYEEEILSSSGDKLYKAKVRVVGEGGAVDDLSVEVSSGSGGGQTKVTAEELERIKAQNAKATNMNAMISAYQAAVNAQSWADAETTLKRMLEMEPGRWEFLQALGNAQSNLKEYDDAAASFSKGIEAAQAVVAGTAPKGSGASAPDPVKAKAGIGQMLGAQGNVYIKLNKMDLAVAAFTKAAEMDPNPGTAYFNLCATQYNMGQMKAAAVACDKAITADPKKADAYFIKGSALYGDGKLDANNKYIVPPGTTDALNKYLELAPDGGHAADVKAMLEALGAKIETTYKSRKK